VITIMDSKENSYVTEQSFMWLSNPRPLSNSKFHLEQPREFAILL
jgi:hypothetical protein